LARIKNGKFFPTSYKSILQNDIPQIVKYLSAVFRGICNYYCFSDNYYDTHTIYNYYGKYCTAMTIAHKTKSKISKIFKKYGVNITILNENNEKLVYFGKYKSDKLKKQLHNLRNLPVKYLYKNVQDILNNNLKFAKMSIVKNKEKFNKGCS